MLRDDDDKGLHFIFHGTIYYITSVKKKTLLRTKILEFIQFLQQDAAAF